jgi:SIR2-like domain
VALSYELRQEFLKGNLVLFVGAGFVKNYLPQMPLWPDLLQQVFQNLSGDALEIYKYCDPFFDGDGKRIIHPGDFLRLAQQFELARERINKERSRSGQQLIPCIHEQIQRSMTEDYDADLSRSRVQGTNFLNARELPLPIWVTTNFDSFLEDTFFEEGILRGTDVLLSRPIRNVDFAAPAGGGRTLLKIHGSVSNPRPEDSIVITEEDYHRFLRQDRYIINKLYTLFCERTVVFLGYSLNDPNIQSIYHDVLFDQKAGDAGDDLRSFSQIRPSFFISRTAIPAEQKVYYRHKRIQYIENYSIEKFLGELGNTYQEFLEGQEDISARIRANPDVYQEWYQIVDSDIDPDGLGIDDDEKENSLSQLLDLVELFEVVYQASGSTAKLDEFEPGNLSLCVRGIMKVAEQWCTEFLKVGRTELMELLLNFVQVRLRLRKSSIVRRLLEDFGDWLEDFAIHDIDRFVQRYCILLFKYDTVYNDWEDYTYCLSRYVGATQLYQHMPNPTKRRIVEGLYRQLSMCGRSVGDSWFTTNRVYDVWPNFNAEVWPALEAEIRSHGLSHRNQAMLDHLRPGADPRQFLPRVA